MGAISEAIFRYDKYMCMLPQKQYVGEDKTSKPINAERLKNVNKCGTVEKCEGAMKYGMDKAIKAH